MPNLWFGARARMHAGRLWEVYLQSILECIDSLPEVLAEDLIFCAKGIVLLLIVRKGINYIFAALLDNNFSHKATRNIRMG